MLSWRLAILIQNMYAELLLCVQSGTDKLCLVRPFQPVLATDGHAVNNEFECPLLFAEQEVIVVPVHSVRCSVSIVHECGHTCVFSTQHSGRRVEREIIDSVRLQYIHDLSNNLYCLNVYCMHHT